MPTTEEQTDLQDFQTFVSKRLATTGKEHTLDEAVAEFRKYQAQLAELREKLDRSEQSADEHGAIQLIDDFLAERYDRLNKKLEEEGITE